MKIDEMLRVIGSISVIAAYFVILHVDAMTGVLMNLVADIMTVPYFIRTKSWDIVIMVAFLATISVSKLVSPL